MSQSKQIGTFKAIGYNSRQIASSFTINIFIIVFFGGFLSILCAFPLVSWFKRMYIDTTLATEMLATTPSFMVFLTSIILPMILISLLIWFFVGLILKKPVTSLLNDTTANKPNFLVRGSSVVTRHLPFTTAYATKNGIRAIGKSFVTFVSIFFATTLLLFGILVSSFADKASESTLGLMNYDSQSYATDRVASLSEEEISLYGNNYDDDLNGTDYSYDFGVGFDYSTYDENTNPEAYQRDMSDPNTNVWNKVFPTKGGYNPNNLTDRFKAWQQDIIYYMRTTEVSRDKSYIEIIDPDFLKSFANTAYLYAEISVNGTSKEKELLTQNLEFYTTSMFWSHHDVEVQELKNLSLEQMLNKMLMLISNSIDKTGDTVTIEKILFDIYETPDKEVSLFKSTDSNIQKINGVQQELINDELYWMELLSGPRVSFEKSTFNLTSWHRKDDLNKELLDYQNTDPTVLPVIIDYPTSKLMGIKEGDTIELHYGSGSNREDVEQPSLKLKVIGIYETYFALPWFAISDEPALITYLEEIDMYQTNQTNTDYMWYSESNIAKPNQISISDINNREFKQEELLTPKTYSCMTSGAFYNETFYFVGSGDENTSTLENQQGNYNPISNMSPCFSKDIPTEYYIAFSEEATNLMNQMLGIFVGFAYMIVFIILLVVSNETIQGSKREVSTLKALGYKTRTMSKIVLLGQSLIMIVSIFVALPFTILVMNLITTLLLNKVGMFFDLTPAFRDIAIVIGVVLIIVVVMYVLGTIIYKYTSSLDSLQRDA